MSQKFPISNPARFATPTAVGFTDGAGTLALVSQGAPLPVTITNPSSLPDLPAAPKPLAGRTASSTVVGPFKPTGSTPIHLQLSGTWVGRASLERSTDGGATRQGLTVGGRRWGSFTGNANEPVWQESEAGVTFWLDVQISSGELAYRVSQ
jgi:hypothetical protein